MNKIIEIIEKREKKIERTGSPWDWQQGYPESQWELLCRLENGSFIEDSKQIYFHTTNNEKIGLPKKFLISKTNEKAIYGTMGAVHIEKNLINKDIFEITDRVGHYIKIRVEPMFDIAPSNKKNYKFVKLNKRNLSFLYLALSKGLFDKPQKGQIYFETHNDEGATLYFKNDYYIKLTNSIDTSYIQGKFAKSNAESDWNNLKYMIDKAEISNKDNIEKLKLYSIYE